jgi:hypothetical protein
VRKSKDNRSSQRAARITRGPALFFAFFALILQTVGMALCPCGLEDAAAHSHAGMAHHHHEMMGDASGDHRGHNDQMPAHQEMCPFNFSAHCYAPLVDAPVLVSLERIIFVAGTSVPAPLLVPERARFPAGAPPCGPPMAA